MSPVRPDGGFDLDDNVGPIYPVAPLTDDERAKLRAAGLTDEEVARLDRVRLDDSLGDARLPDSRP